MLQSPVRSLTCHDSAALKQQTRPDAEAVGTQTVVVFPSGHLPYQAGKQTVP